MYRQLQEQVTAVDKQPVPADANKRDEFSAQAAQAAVPPLSVDFEVLKQISGDAAAWLYGPDTPIHYPVMRADDYNWYLRHLPDGTYNANGSLFLDYNGAQDFSGRLSIIYGHNMNSGAMFNALTRYKEQAYFEEHPYLYLYTEQGNYRIDLLYGCVIGAGEWRERAFMYEMNLESLMTYAAEHTTFASGVSYTESSRILALSTCSYEFDDARYVVLGVLVPAYEDTAK